MTMNIQQIVKTIDLYFDSFELINTDIHILTILTLKIAHVKSKRVMMRGSFIFTVRET